MSAEENREKEKFFNPDLTNRRPSATARVLEYLRELITPEEANKVILLLQMSDHEARYMGTYNRPYIRDPDFNICSGMRRIQIKRESGGGPIFLLYQQFGEPNKQELGLRFLRLTSEQEFDLLWDTLNGIVDTKVASLLEE